MAPLIAAIKTDYSELVRAAKIAGESQGRMLDLAGIERDRLQMASRCSRIVCVI